MALIFEVAVGVILGIIVTKWLSALPHKLRVKGYTRALLTSSDTDIMLLALHGHEQIFNMSNRNWLIELYFCKDAVKRRQLAARIAQDAADRWAKVGSGKGEGMPALINSEERKQLGHLGQEIDSLAGMIKTAEKLGVRLVKEEGAH